MALGLSAPYPYPRWFPITEWYPHSLTESETITQMAIHLPLIKHGSAWLNYGQTGRDRSCPDQLLVDNGQCGQLGVVNQGSRGWRGWDNERQQAQRPNKIHHCWGVHLWRQLSGINQTGSSQLTGELISEVSTMTGTTRHLKGDKSITSPCLLKKHFHQLHNYKVRSNLFISSWLNWINKLSITDQNTLSFKLFSKFLSKLLQWLSNTIFIIIIWKTIITMLEKRNLNHPE